MKDRDFWKSRLWGYVSSGVGAISLSAFALVAGESDEEVADAVRGGLPALTMYGLDSADARLAGDRIFQLAWDKTARFKSEIYENNDGFPMQPRIAGGVTRLLAKHRLVIGGDEAPTTENSIATHDELPAVAPVEAAENKPPNSSVGENDQP